MARPVQPNGAELRNLIRKNAATPTGYLTADSVHLAAHPQSAKTCERMIAAGQLFRASYPGSRMRYFDSAEAVAIFQSQPKPPRVTSPRKSRAKPAHLLKAKPAKPPKAIKPPKVKAPKVAKKPEYVIARKPYVAPVPRKTAVIVYPERYKFSSRPMTDRYAVTVPLVHIGSADWSKGVGCAA